MTSFRCPVEGCYRKDVHEFHSKKEWLQIQKNKEKLDHKWWHTNDTVHTFCSHLIDRKILTTPRQVLDFILKPWLWDNEWEKYESK